MATILIGLVAVVVLWPLSAVYRAFGPLPLLAISGVVAVVLFVWTNRDSRR
jgi:hypothetical protein